MRAVGVYLRIVIIIYKINSSTVSREPVRRWGIGIQGGYGMGLSNGQVKASSDSKQKPRARWSGAHP